MNLTTFLTVVIVGTLTGNVMIGSGIGLDLASNNLNSIKNALIFSLFVTAVSLISGVCVFLANLWLVASGNAGFLVLVGMLIVAIFVQIAEYVMKKLTPIVHTHIKSILVVLIPTITIILFSLLGEGVGFGEFLLSLVFTCVGMIAVMVTICGVRQNKLTYATYDVFKGNLMTLVVLFVLALVWTAV